jgi:hypothetical protein
MQQPNISTVFEEYFEIIDSYFGAVKHLLGKDSRSHIELGNSLARYPHISDLILDSTDDLAETITEFWTLNSNTVSNYLISQKSLKCVYSGGTTPFDLESFIKKTSLYVDSVIIPDPLFSISVISRPIVDDRKFYLGKLIRHVFNVWKLRDLVLANTAHKIIIPYPTFLHALPSDIQKKMFLDAQAKSLAFLNNVCDTQYDNFENISEVFGYYSSTKEVFNSFKYKEALPAEFLKMDKLNAVLTDLILMSKRIHKDTLRTSGQAFCNYVFSQFFRVQEHLYFSKMLKAEPIYDYALPWHFYNYDNGGLNIDRAIINALQKDEFNWIGNIPLSIIPNLREENELEYMRSTLRKGLYDIYTISDTNLSRTIEQIAINIQEAFEKQRAERKRLQEKIEKITLNEIPITIGAHLLGYVPFLGQFISIPFVARDIAHLYKEVASSDNKIESMNSGPIGLLMGTYERIK